jgi:luciferase family oxidoreductase group 1
MKIGVLDLGKQLAGLNVSQRIEHTIELARLAEQHNFDRYWLAEHHVTDTALAAPEVVLSILAAATNRIKLGPGGLLLRYYSPLKVAELYLTLAAAFPGRIDLGVCRGPGVVNENVELALVSGNTEELTDDSYEAKVGDLFFLLDPVATRPDWLIPRPQGVTPPPIWLLGSGSRTAQHAVRNSARYGFMCFFPGPERHGPELLRQYRAEIERHPVEGPLIALSVICGETSEDARRMDDFLVGRGSMRSNVVGDAESCLATIRETACRYGVDEVLVASFSPHLADHARMIASLGSALKP